MTSREPSIKQLRNKSNTVDRKIVKLIKEASTAKPRRLKTIRKLLKELRNKSTSLFNQLLDKSNSLAQEIEDKANNLIQYTVGDINKLDAPTKQLLQDYYDDTLRLYHEITDNDAESNYKTINDNRWTIITDLIDYNKQISYSEDPSYIFNNN